MDQECFLYQENYLYKIVTSWKGQKYNIKVKDFQNSKNNFPFSFLKKQKTKTNEDFPKGKKKNQTPKSDWPYNVCFKCVTSTLVDKAQCSMLCDY